MKDPRMEWMPITGPAGQGERLSLYVGGAQAARMHQRLNGSWYASLHHPDRPALDRPCTSLESGKAGCEAWATRHIDALLAHAEVRHLTWLAQQTWRGPDCIAARAKLTAIDRHTAGKKSLRASPSMSGLVPLAGLDQLGDQEAMQFAKPAV